METVRPDALQAAAEMIGHDARMLGDLSRLIAVDTSFPPGVGYPAMAHLLDDLLPPLGFETQRVEVPRELWDPGTGDVEGPRVNLIATRRTGRPVCSVYFHVDTVPAGAGWTRPPLTMTLEDGRVYGRGTSDMKGTIAAVLAGLRAAQEAGLELCYDPALLFCTDEEGGLYPGIRWLAEEGMIEGHLLSFNGQAAPRIWAGCFGSLDFRIEVEGRAAHSGDGTGVNAIEEALPLLQALVALKERVESRTSALPPPPGRETPLHARLTLAAANGGAKGSALPGRFTILVNRRYCPEEDPDAVLGELEEAVEEALRPTRVFGFSTSVVGHLAPVIDPTGPHWPRWQAALSAGFGWSPESFRAWGASSSSDMGWVQRAGIKEILLGGLGRPTSNGHGADEHTTVADLTALARSLLYYFASDFSPSGPNPSQEIRR